jgi:hypothetical protein
MVLLWHKLMVLEVICGRVADASPVIGAAMWWHSWGREAYDKLAYALVAGHLIVSFSHCVTISPG